MTITFAQARKEVEEIKNSKQYHGRCVPVKSCGNTTVTLVNDFIKLGGKWIAKNVPHRKISFVNSVGKQTSNILKSRQGLPLIYRYLKDVFDVEKVQHLPAGIKGSNNVQIALLFLIDNVSKCFWPSAFFDDGVSEDNEQLAQEWIHNREINPYFTELVAQAKAIIKQDQSVAELRAQLVERNRKFMTIEQLVAAELNIQ